MWLGEKLKAGGEEFPVGAEVGQVTLGGAALAVVTQGERRELTMALPGGFRWKPALGEKVLVLTSREGEAIVIGQLPGKNQLRPGELEMQGPNCSIKLTEGRVEIDGELIINGEPYKPCTCTGGIL